MKMNNLVGTIIALLILAMLAGCTTPRVVNYPDGSQTVKVNGRKCHIRTVDVEGGKYVLALCGLHGHSFRPIEDPKPKHKCH